LLWKNSVQKLLGRSRVLDSEYTALSFTSGFPFIVTPLEPFAVQTDVLQSNTQSLSTIIPSLLNLECHLQQSSAPKTLTSKLRTDFRCRFAFILDQVSINFNLLPAAACLLDPSLADVLLSPDLSSLLHAAKMMILKLSGQGLSSSNDATPDSSVGPPALKRFKFLATRLETTTTSSSTLFYQSKTGHCIKSAEPVHSNYGRQIHMQFYN
jgi:hypothetical protein